MTKRDVLCLSLVVVCVTWSSTLGAQALRPADAVVQFFEASRNGDTETIKRLIAGSFYDQRKVLLEQNKQYGEFLRTRYQGTEIWTGNVRMKGDGTVGVVDVRILFPGGDVDTEKFLLKKGDDGAWKIVGQM